LPLPATVLNFARLDVDRRADAQRHVDRVIVVALIVESEIARETSCSIELQFAEARERHARRRRGTRADGPLNSCRRAGDERCRRDVEFQYRIAVDRDRLPPGLY